MPENADEPRLDDLLADETMLSLMARDGVSIADLHALIAGMRALLFGRSDQECVSPDDNAAMLARAGSRF